MEPLLINLAVESQRVFFFPPQLGTAWGEVEVYGEELVRAVQRKVIGLVLQALGYCNYS